MTANSFINSMRNLIAIRGPVRLMRCDQGTNFVGASHEFKKAFKEMDFKSIESKAADLQCEFKFNIPSSSHMGGIWERQIKSIRSVLSGILDQYPCRLDSSSLRTFLYEAMAVVNSRPICVLNVNDPMIEPLTPNMLLTHKSKVILPPPGEFVETDVYSRRRWRNVQFLTNEFWSRWRHEYLGNLTQRQKWQKASRNYEIGDIVILKEAGAFRCEWCLAKVIEVYPSSDSLVRKVKLLFGDRSVLERPVHKLVLLWHPRVPLLVRPPLLSIKTIPDLHFI